MKALSELNIRFNISLFKCSIDTVLEYFMEVIYFIKIIDSYVVKIYKIYKLLTSVYVCSFTAEKTPVSV